MLADFLFFSLAAGNTICNVAGFRILLINAFLPAKAKRISGLHHNNEYGQIFFTLQPKKIEPK